MQNSNSNKFKIAFIVSLILNLAFVSGFVTKKFIFPRGPKKAPVEECEQYCQTTPYRIDYQDLCQTCPQFKETFRSHKDDYQHASRDLIKIKTEFLNELKKEDLNEEAVEKLLKEINRLTSKLNEKNHRHLLTLRKLLEPKDFTLLIKCMNQALHTHEQGHVHREGEHVLHEHKN
jgi:hypothetical protein